MIDAILIIIICSIFIVGLVTTFIWKKRYFVKELYFEKCVTIVLYVITIAATIGLILVYCLTTRGKTFSWLYLLIVTLFDLLFVSICCYLSTKCIYISNHKLISKSIFCTKSIELNTKTNIKENFDKTSIYDDKTVISISCRYLSGNIRYIISEIKNNTIQ